MSMITLGVDDIERAIAFYQHGLGFPRHGTEDDVAFFALDGTWLGLFGRAALAADARREAFFRCWTRKEAYLKAVGVGLAGGLAQCRVSLDHEHAALLEVAWDPAEADRWWMVSWQPRPGYAAALCVAQPRAAVMFHEWQP
jgi:catechol 2,3-dioxygenase-like lactoylglutathione lyase family enzyme